MPERVSDEFLVQRVKALHNRLATQQLLNRGVEVTAEKLAYSLGFSTVSVVDTMVNGRVVRIVTTNDSKFYRILAADKAKLLLPGEIIGSRPTNVYGPKEPRQRPPRQTIHAEQLGVNDAVHMGAKSGRIATSNAGCTDMCVSLLKDEFPTFQHVNPANPKPNSSVHVHKGKPSAPMPEAKSPAPSTLHAEASDVAQAERRGVTSDGHEIENRLTSGSRLDDGAPQRIERALETAGHVPGETAGHAGARLMPHPGVSMRALGAAERGVKTGLKAKSLLIGVKAWRAARRLGKVVITFFVPMTLLDVVIEIAFAIFDRHQAGKEKAERGKRKALEAVFKQANTIQRLAEARLNDPKAQQEFMDAWDRSSAVSGFRYARVEAIVEIEVFSDVRGEEIEDLTRYRDAKIVSALPLSWLEFELKEIDRTPLEPTDDDTKRMIAATGSTSARKFLIRKSVKHTIVPPVSTPFDIAITKINNLFLDLVYFIWEFNSFGEGMVKNFTGFNYKTSYKEQFEVEIDFPKQVNKAMCEYCLSYLHWAAKELSRHALERADLEGNLENAQKGFLRRMHALDAVFYGTDTKYGKSFRNLTRQINKIVPDRAKTGDVAAALAELYGGVEAVVFDLSRIGAKRFEREYLYFGPH